MLVLQEVFQQAVTETQLAVQAVQAEEQAAMAVALHGLPTQQTVVALELTQAAVVEAQLHLQPL
jgi:uncharacterized protein (UPF0210 family)